jgi:hypothetical protein
VRDAETMLFVHDAEAQPPEFHRIPIRRARHEQVQLARGERCPRSAGAAPAQAAGQESRAHAGLSSHEARLAARCSARISVGAMSAHPARRFRGEKKGEPGHDGLPAADVPLEQAGHRPPGRQVCRDLPQRALLGSRQTERERFPRRLAHHRVGREDDPGALPQTGPLLFDRGREHEELFPGEDAARLLGFLLARRKVRALQGAKEPIGRQASRARFPREPVERRPREHAPGPRRDARDAVIDPDDPARVEGIGLLASFEEPVPDSRAAALRPASRAESRRARAPARLRRLHERGYRLCQTTRDRSGASSATA